ncbi:MAG: hypothetical protein MK135_16600 [Polyangiaceae bacterium]|nr:hypothetical protein [Polyangiaceae bacterium]
MSLSGKKDTEPARFTPALPGTEDRWIGGVSVDYDYFEKNKLEFFEKGPGGKKGFRRAPTFIILAHELVHAYRVEYRLNKRMYYGITRENGKIQYKLNSKKK